MVGTSGSEWNDRMDLPATADRRKQLTYEEIPV